MHKARIILILGIWVAILPYLGFPIFWKNVLFSVTGLAFIYFSFLMYREYKIVHADEIIADNFSDNLENLDDPDDIALPEAVEDILKDHV